MKTYNAITISDTLDERLLDVCAALNTSPSALIAECVAAYLSTKEVEAACAPEVAIADPMFRQAAAAARERITERIMPRARKSPLAIAHSLPAAA